jgi:hypothetical protein
MDHPMSNSRKILVTTWLLTGVLAACDHSPIGPGSGPDCVAAASVSGSLSSTLSYNYNICDVPDIDQRKTASAAQNIAGLENGGNCYCVPTAAINLLSYIAQRGYAQLRPGAADYQLGPPTHPDLYNAVTLHQAVLGGSAYMSLNPGPSAQTGGCGVGPSTARPAIEDWIADDGLGSSFTVMYYGEDEVTGYVPRLHDAALAGIWGTLVLARIGWYSDTLGTGALSRTGGHVVTFVHGNGQALSGGGLGTVSFNDPWTSADAGNLAQSTFVREVHPTLDLTETYATDAGEVVRTRTRIMGGYSGDRGRLDGYYAILPKFGLTEGSDGSIQLLRPIALGSLVEAGRRELLPATVDVADMVIVPHRVDQPFVVRGSSRVRMVSLVDGRLTDFATVPSAVTALAFGGRAGLLYAVTEDEVLALDREGEIVHRAGIRIELQAIAYDGVGDRLLALDAENGVLYAYSAELGGPDAIDLQDWPAGAPVSASLSVDPRSGTVWVLPDGSGTAFVLARDGGWTTVTLADVPLHGLHVGDDERVYAVRNGVIASFQLDGREAGDTPFDGAPAMGRIRIIQSWSNVNPDRERGPAWDNVPPEV